MSGPHISHKYTIYMYLMKTEGVEVLGIRGEDVLLQPVQGDAKDLKHLEGEREIEVEIHNQEQSNHCQFSQTIES